MADVVDDGVAEAEAAAEFAVLPVPVPVPVPVPLPVPVVVKRLGVLPPRCFFKGWVRKGDSKLLSGLFILRTALSIECQSTSMMETVLLYCMNILCL
jgi:hypothetical protein